MCFFRINLENPWKQPRNECLIRQYGGRTCSMILFPNLLVGSALGPYYCHIHHPCWNSRSCSWRQPHIHSKYKGFDSKCPWTYHKYLLIAIEWCTRQHTPTNHIHDDSPPKKIATNMSKHTETMPLSHMVFHKTSEFRPTMHVGVQALIFVPTPELALQANNLTVGMSSTS